MSEIMRCWKCHHRAHSGLCGASDAFHPSGCSCFAEASMPAPTCSYCGETNDGHLQTPAPPTQGWELVCTDRGLGRVDYAIKTPDGLVTCPSQEIAISIMEWREASTRKEGGEDGNNSVGVNSGDDRGRDSGVIETTQAAVTEQSAEQFYHRAREMSVPQIALLLRDFEELRRQHDSWRRIAERLEGEKQELQRQLADKKEELDHVLGDWNDLVKASGSRTNGGAIGHVTQMKDEITRLREAIRNAQDLLGNMHRDAKRETGNWWRGECADGCQACEVQGVLGAALSAPTTENKP
jgi:hypothetical protein